MGLFPDYVVAQIAEAINISIAMCERLGAQNDQKHGWISTIKLIHWQIAWEDAINSIEIIFCTCGHRAVTDGIRNTQHAKPEAIWSSSRQLWLWSVEPGVTFAGPTLSRRLHDMNMAYQFHSLPQDQGLLIIWAIENRFSSITKDRHLKTSHLRNCEEIMF